MKLSVDGGGEGEAVCVEGEVLHAVIDRAFAPGAPLRVSVAGASLDVKTVGSKRREDGRFDVRLRLRNVRREDRARLESLGRAPADE